MKMMMKALMAALIVSATSGARAETVVVVSAKSSTTNLTQSQVADIFLGQSALEMTPVDQADSALRAGFYKKVADKEPGQVKAIWAKLVFTGKAIMPKEFGSSADVKKVIAANPNTIGYIDKNAVDSSVRVVFAVQ